MSILALQFGQCGNQLGQSLFGLLEQDVGPSQGSSAALNRWFSFSEKGGWQPRAILVDTETKVVDALRGSFRGASVVAQPAGGSANNWAFGYTETSRLVAGDVLNCVRQEVERCDFLMSFLGLYSLAGGTGSGVGSRVLEQLRDHYPKKTLISCAVLPHPSGEIATQAFNSLLNLARLYPVANSTVLFANGPNSPMAHRMAAVLQPVPGLSVAGLSAELAPHPGLRFLQVRAEPRDEQLQWGPLCQALMQAPAGKLVGQCLIKRGGEPLPVGLERQLLDSKVGWAPRGRLWAAERRFLHYPRHMARVVNGVPPLERLVEDAWGAFTHGAYVHHYSKFGVDADWFLGAFQAVEDVLGAYKAL